ncbi:MAG: hypothetical protein GY717_14170 [Rhodobacteraceae bacterium]|nr:hypothetical protein [Paracoccaceae bacterium]
MKREIDLAPATWAALSQVSSAEGTAIDALVADAVHRDLYRRTRARKAERPDERLIADDFAFSSTWEDLQARLDAKGYWLMKSGAGLAVCDKSNGCRVCKASDLGNSHARLARKLGTAFPGHTHPQAIGAV